MLFCSWTFAQFLLVVATVYWFLPDALRRLQSLGRAGAWLARNGDELRVVWLLLASVYFYASWNSTLALVVCGSTLLDYAIGLGLEATERPGRRRALVVLSVVGNLSVLAYFKYVNFFLDSLAELGVGRSLPVLRVLAPIGISFYTFEAISYTVDVYRRRAPAERNPAHLLLFVLFFPHLICGPIVRARDFLPQMRRTKRWSWPRAQLAAEYFLLGLIKKWVVADQLAAYADPVFADPLTYGTAAHWVALTAFTMQVYCDISGYSDMALGTAHLLGYKLTVNFNAPYLATSVADYWRRNHISLSTWLRDYLFIPLGGNRCGRWLTYRNYFITMTLGGLWHGASWAFVLWGVLHGVYLSFHLAFREFCSSRPGLTRWLESPAGTAARMALTFFCILQGFVLFRATTLAAAGSIVNRLWVPTPGASIPHVTGTALFWIVLAGFVAAHVAGRLRLWHSYGARLSPPVKAALYVTALVACTVMAPGDEKQFLYFQF